MKIPFLTTAFSESGKRAKRRFMHILDTKTKKSGILLLLVLTVLSAGICMVFAFTEEKKADMNMTQLHQLGEQPIGADMAELCYADDSTAIFYYSNGLFVFNMQTELMEQMIDLSKLHIPLNTQGDKTIDVFASTDGTQIYLTGQGAVDKNKFICWCYDIKSNKISKLFTDYQKYEQWRAKNDFFNSFSDSSVLTETLGSWLSHKTINTNSGTVVLGLAGSYVKDIVLYRMTGNNLESYSPFNYIYLEEKSKYMDEMHTLLTEIGSESNAEKSITAHLPEFVDLSGGYDIQKMRNESLCQTEPYQEIAALAEVLGNSWQKQIDALYSRSHELDLFSAADELKTDTWFSNRPQNEPLIGGKASTVISGFYDDKNHPQLVVMDLNLGNIFHNTYAPIFATRLTYYDKVQISDTETDNIYDKGIYKPHYEHFAGHEIVERTNNGTREYYLKDNINNSEYLVFRED